jgi:hypothetical protein
MAFWRQKPDETTEEWSARTEARKEKQRQLNKESGLSAKGNAARRAQGDKAPKVATPPAVTKKALQTTLSMLNGVVAMFSPIDALGKVQMGEQIIDEEEMVVDAVLETQATSPTFRRYLSRFINAAGSASLLGTIALLIYVRLDRRGFFMSRLGGGARPGPGPSASTMAGHGVVDATGAPPPSSTPANPATSESDFWAQKEYERNNPGDDGILATG